MNQIIPRIFTNLQRMLQSRFKIQEALSILREIKFTVLVVTGSHWTYTGAAGGCGCGLIFQAEEGQWSCKPP